MMLDAAWSHTSVSMKLGAVAAINPRFDGKLKPDASVPFVPMAAVSAVTAAVEAEEQRAYADVAKGYTAFRDGDVIVAKITPCFENNKIAHARLSGPVGFGSTEFHVIRPDPARLDARYVLHFLRQDYVRTEGERKMTGSAGQRRIPAHVLADLDIPLPAVDEQQRIAAILDEADALRAKRRAALAHLDEIPQAMFLDWFGHPVMNPKEHSRLPLEKVASIQSGGTPSKDRAEYWGEGLPWVSPKDMKTHRITDSLDHVTPLAVKHGGLKIVPKAAILVVVRGMILAHSVPVAIADRELTINQDMKALQFTSVIAPEVALWCLRVQENNILEDIATASHGTKRLDTERLAARPILLPGQEKQQAFTCAIVEWELARTKMRGQLKAADTLFASLQHRAFRGDL